MKGEILNLMNARRKVEGIYTKYKELNRMIGRKYRETKEKWWSERCNEIEDHQEKHNSLMCTGKLSKYPENFEGLPQAP